MSTYPSGLQSAHNIDLRVYDNRVEASVKNMMTGEFWELVENRFDEASPADSLQYAMRDVLERIQDII